MELLVILTTDNVLTLIALAPRQSQADAHEQEESLGHSPAP